MIQFIKKKSFTPDIVEFLILILNFIIENSESDNQKQDKFSGVEKEDMP
jgi:hypothetical protein